ncbi:MAG: 16S rRNA (guanine(966)-N(2))-methyltransferase RsmD [Burkholderiaceae bacterium]|nr:16S rRNA (guanine(966)-N(2))-methyltransferase RsmD [Burkholderiaceae bacterium]
MSTVRIVGGVWRRTPVVVPDRPGLRPTPDRVRETLFNWLGQTLAGWRVLDAFAGSGALGLEAASRGAAEVVMVESDRVAATAIARQLERLRGAGDAAARAAAEAVDLRREDILRVLPALAAAGRRFDLVLLDPPFGQGWLARILPLLPPLLEEGARLHVESDAAIDPDELAAGLPAGSGGLVSLRLGRAGQVHYHLLEYRPISRPDLRS